MDWEYLTIFSLKEFVTILLYMGMKCQPYQKSYWHNKVFIFHRLVISNIMTHAYLNHWLSFYILQTQLGSRYIREKDLPNYGKMDQLWIIFIPCTTILWWVCKDKLTQLMTYCSICGKKYMSYRRWCFKIFHGGQMR